MIWNLLTSESTSSSGNGGGAWGTWLMMGILLVIIVVFMVFNRRTQKKRQQETTNMLNAIKPGNKVKTIGGICGIVVEVCDDNTFVLETGTEASGKSYLKFDKQAVYQTDAVVEKPVETTPAEVKEEPAEAPAAEEVKEEVKEETEKSE